MKIAIRNIGKRPIRVITDDDPQHDTLLDPGASETFESEDIELRDFERDDERDEDDDEASGTDSEPSST